MSKYLFILFTFFLILGADRSLFKSISAVEINSKLIDFPTDLELSYSLSMGPKLSIPNNHQITCSLGESVEIYKKSDLVLKTWCAKKIYLVEFEKAELEKLNVKTDRRDYLNPSVKIEMILANGSTSACWDKLSSHLSLERVNDYLILGMKDFIGHNSNIVDGQDCNDEGLECKKIKFRKVISGETNHHVSIKANSIKITENKPFGCLVNEEKGIYYSKNSKPSCHRNEIFPDKDYDLIEGISTDVSIDVISNKLIINVYERHHQIEIVDLSIINNFSKTTASLKNKNFSCHYKTEFKFN